MGRRKLTTEEYIKQCRQIHEDKYDYSNTVYVGSQDDVTVGCKKHGSFSQNASRHLRGHGCKLCSTEKSRMGQEEFIALCQSVHNNKYDYSLTIYEGNSSLLQIGCPIHGFFTQKANKHLHANTGCPKCANKNQNTEDFVRKACIAHGDKYNYSKSVYVNDTTKLIIVCPIHGEFTQLPSNHHSLKQGCPGCKREKSRVDKPGYFCETLFRIKPELKDIPSKLYWVRFISKDRLEIFDKVGITIQSIEQRFCGSEYDIGIVTIQERPLYEAFSLEQQILRLVKPFQYIPKNRFSGWTECFSLDVTTEIQIRTLLG